MILPKVRDPRLVTIRRGGSLTDDDHHLLALWAAECAEHVLPLFEAGRPDDPRPRAAIEAARSWARGELPMMQARALGGHAMGAARDLTGAPRFAAYAAGQAAVVAHVAEHDLGAAAYADQGCGGGRLRWTGGGHPPRRVPVAARSAARGGARPGAGGPAPAQRHLLERLRRLGSSGAHRLADPVRHGDPVRRRSGRRRRRGDVRVRPPARRARAARGVDLGDAGGPHTEGDRRLRRRGARRRRGPLPPRRRARWPSSTPTSS